MNVLFVTDPLDRLAADIDASIGLMAAAQHEGADVWVCEPADLAIRDGRVEAGARRLRLRPRERDLDHRWRVDRDWFDAVEEVTLDVVADVGIVLLRIDPPADARYLHATYLLDFVEAAGVAVVNRPAGIRAVHEKLCALIVPELCPPTLVTARPQDVVEFVERVGTAVVKPVDGFAGMDVWQLRDDASATALAESATRLGTQQVIVQQYLDDVEAGNKRLFVLDGEIIGAVTRTPSAHDFRIGPPVASADIEPMDEKIVAAMAPTLGRHGLALAGFDVIGGRLIEVNVTCPGGMHKTDALLGTDLSGTIMRHLLERAARGRSLSPAPRAATGRRRD